MGIIKKATEGGSEYARRFFGGTYYGDDLWKYEEILRHRREVMEGAVYRFAEQLDPLSSKFPDKAKDLERFMYMTLQEFGERAFPLFPQRDLDIPEALAELNPKLVDLGPLNASICYSLTCPKCGKPGVLLSANSTRIGCNQENCGLSASIWVFVSYFRSLRGR